MTTKKQGAAAPNEEFEPQIDDLVVGRSYKCGAHLLTIRKIEMHYLNWQVNYFDSFEQKLSWEHISRFRKMLATQNALI